MSEAVDEKVKDKKSLITQLEEEGDVAADYLEGLLDIADLDGDIDIEESQSLELTKIKIKSNLNKKIEETINWYKNKFEENFYKNNKFKNRNGLNI